MAQIAFVDWDGLVYYDSKNKQYIADKLAPCLKNGGVIEFKDLPKPSFKNLNYIYIISDEFTSDENFIENKFTNYSANSAVIVIEDPQLGFRYSVIKTQSWDDGDYNDLHARVDDLTSDVLDISKNLLEVTNDLANEHTRVDELEERVNNISPGGSGENPSLEGYATLQYVDNKFATKTEVANFVTETELESKGYLTEHQDISGKADKATTLSGYGITDAYTRTEIDAKLLEIESGGKIDEETLKGFVSEDEWNERISSYATKGELEKVQTTAGNNSVLIRDIDSELVDINDRIDNINIPTNVSAFTNDAGYLTEHQSLDGYAKTSEIPDVSNFIPRSEVEAALGNKANNILFTEDYKVSNSIGNIDSNYDVKGKTIAQLLIDLLGLDLVAVRYSIKFMVDDSIYSEATYEEGDAIKLPAPPSKYGYTFKGWKTHDDIYIKDGYKMPNIDLVVNAEFTEDSGGDEPEEYITIEDIKQNNIPMLSGSTESSELKAPDNIEEEITISDLSSKPLDKDPGTTIFYEYSNRENADYQFGYIVYTIDTASNRENYSIAIPKGFKIKSIDMWDADISKWASYNPTFTQRTDEHIYNNVIYVIYDSSADAAGEILRVRLEEIN